MHAIIMAGGEGSRLRPLTCDIPKPMVRLCGRPIIEYILDLLSENGCRTATLTLGYMPHIIREHFPDGQYGSIRLQFTEEKIPLGTAGGVKNAAGTLREDFLVISGDGLCDFDLKAAYAFHRNNNADVTIVVTRVEDPREYGLVNTDGEGNVVGFTEKPAWTGVTTNLANTGIYILKPEVLAMIPDARSYDFAAHLFPAMLSEGKPIKAYEAKGYWCDIGDLASYRQCQQDMMNGHVKNRKLTEVKRGIFGSLPPAGTYKLFPPVYLGERVQIGEGAVIGPDAVIDDGTEIGAGARVRSGVVLPGVIIGATARITGSIIGTGSTVGNDAALYEGCTLGSSAVIGKNSEVLPGVLIWPGKRIPEDACIRENVRIGEGKQEFFDEKGIAGLAGVDITPEFCVRLGAAIGSLKNVQRIGIGYTDCTVAKIMHYALMAGITGTGAQVWDFGQLMASQMNFAASFCGMSASVLVNGAEPCTIQIYGADGLPADRETEREIEKNLVKGESIRCQGEHYRDIADMSGIRMLYQQELYRCAPRGLVGLHARTACEHSDGERLFSDTFIRLGGSDAKRPLFTVSQDGTQLTAVDENQHIWDSDRMLALGCLLAFRGGEDVAVAYDAPCLLDRLARREGRRCHRYIQLSGDSQQPVRRLAKQQYFLRDGMMLALKIMNHMKENKITLADMMREIPDFATKVTAYPLRQSPSGVMERLQTIAKPAGQGVSIASGETVIRIWPEKKGKNLRISAEAADAETAEELCADFQSKIADLLDRKGEI